MRADLRFNVGDILTDLRITEAIIGLEAPADTQWPLDNINAALAGFYNSSVAATGRMGSPCLYPVRDDGGVIGYMVMTRSDRYTRQQFYAAFWQILEENELGNASTATFTANTPLNTVGMWDGVEVQVVAYQSEYGPGIPHEAVNDGLRLLSGQSDWGEQDFLYIYPVRKDNGPMMNGLWISRAIENLAEDPAQDDAMFRRVRVLNQAPNVATRYPNFARREYTFV